MSSKTKALLILLSTFVLGLVVGSLATGVLRSQRERRFERMLPRERFHTFVEHVVQPTGEQKEAFESIMTRWSGRLAELHRDHQDQMLAVYDSLHAELTSLLTEEQRNRLEEHLAKGSNKIIKRRVFDLATALDLDEQQQEKLRQITESMPRLRLRRHADRRDWPRHRRIMREHFHKMEEEIEAILTPEQRKKFQEMRHEFGPPFPGPHPDREF